MCNQVLRQRQDVEDAFQATFLILAQKSAAIRATDSAAAWLFKVAQRTALAARRKRSRRREEPLAAEPPQGEAALPLLHERQMRYVLMEELRSLPAQYQTTLVMRYLEGRSRRAIAEQTDSTVGQVQGRLARGRRMLRSRLVRRGVSLSLAVGTLSAASGSVSAAVTPSLVTATADACLSLKTAGTAAGVSSAVIQLAQEGMKTMWFASMTKMTAVFTTVVAVSAASFTIAAGAGEEGGARGGNVRRPAGIELQVSAMESQQAEAPAVTVEAESPNFEVFNVVEPPDVAVRNLIAEQQDEMKKQLQEKVVLSSELQLDDLKKAKLQREVAQLHEMEIKLQLPGDSEQAEERKSREGRIAEIREKLANAEEQLADVIKESSSKAVQAEGIALQAKLAERRLEELMAMRLQFEVGVREGEDPFAVRLRRPQFDVLRRAPATIAVAPERVHVDEVQQKLLQELANLRAENEALKRQVKELAGSSVK